MLQPSVYYFTHYLLRVSAVSCLNFQTFNRHYVPEKGGGLICSNHQSFVDPVLIGISVNRQLTYLARKTLFELPLLGPMLPLYNAIPIDRDGMGIAGIKETLRRIRKDNVVVMFPEGTRSPDGNMLPLKQGFCSIARRARVPLIPAAVAGAFDAWPRDRKLPRPAIVRLAYGEPIPREEYEQWSDIEMTKNLEVAIAKCFEQASQAVREEEGIGVVDAPAEGSHLRVVSE